MALPEGVSFPIPEAAHTIESEEDLFVQSGDLDAGQMSEAEQRFFEAPTPQATDGSIRRVQVSSVESFTLHLVGMDTPDEIQADGALTPGAMHLANGPANGNGNGHEGHANGNGHPKPNGNSLAAVTPISPEMSKLLEEKQEAEDFYLGSLMIARKLAIKHAETESRFPYNIVRPPEIDREVIALQREGYDIEITDTPDPVTDGADAQVLNVMLSLDAKQAVFTERTDWLIRHGLTGKDLYKATEALRDELLYADIGAGPWHDQRGCATALLTVQEAGKGYPTMSAMVGVEVLDTVFADGENLRSKLIHTEIEFSGKERVAAEQDAERRLSQLAEFIQAPVTEGFEEIIKYCTDSLGIRSRKEVVKQLVLERLEESGRLETGDPITMVSLGCGTALPIFEAAIEIKDRGGNPQLHLIDQDPIALAYATQIAGKLGLQDNITVHCERLFDKLGRPLDIERVMAGKKAFIIEDSGLREYLRNRLYSKLTSECWRNTEEGGMMVSGNMNAARVQRDILHGLQGWEPGVDMRLMSVGLTLHERAGISPKSMKIRVTNNGVYTIYSAVKQ